MHLIDPANVLLVYTYFTFSAISSTIDIYGHAI